MKHKTAFLPVVDLLQNFCHFSIIVVLEFNIASRCSNKNTIQNQKQPNLFSSSHQARCGDRAPFSRVLGSQCFLVLFNFFVHKIIQHMDPMLKTLDIMSCMDPILVLSWMNENKRKVRNCSSRICAYSFFTLLSAVLFNVSFPTLPTFIMFIL